MEHAHSHVDPEQPSYDFDFDAEHRADTDGLRPGLHVTPNIELIQPLGTGGMGTVWLAHHSGLETRVAVKFMSSAHAQDAALVERFAREAKLSARIKSPHVVQTFDYATTANGIPFIVMELLEGEDLQALLTKHARLSLEETSRIVVQVCKALSKAHALGVVHRDIKPENIYLVENDGEPFVKVLDFGIAKDQSPVPGITVSGTTMGTPSFMSPEQLFSPKDVGAHSDLWSTAVVAYRALTGRLPFEGDSFGAVCVAINGGRFPKPTTLNSDIPAELDVWFARALARKPSERFTSATEMANAYLSGLHAAGLLPSWAVRRKAGDTLSSFATDPGGISGGPITLTIPRGPVRRRAGKVLLLLVVGVFALWLGAASHRVGWPAQLQFVSLDRVVQLLPARLRPAPLPELAPEVAPPHAAPMESPSAYVVTPPLAATAVRDPARPESGDVPAGITSALPTPGAPSVSARSTTTASRVPQIESEPSPYGPAPTTAAPSSPELDPVGEPAVDPHGI